MEVAPGRPLPGSLPLRWAQSEDAPRFWSRLRASSRSILMLDYDGTLAPFKNNPLEAIPYPGVEARLLALARRRSVRLAIVSGRPVDQVERLLEGASGIEIWGDHGWSHRSSSGEYELASLTQQELGTLRTVRERIAQLGFPHVIELKPASLAVHWRSLDGQSRENLQAAIEAIDRSLQPSGGLRLIPFDGGIELRSPSRNKGTAVNSVLGEEAQEAPAAYLGDDLTDEDGFRALGRRGISLLVRAEPRQSAARYWMKPPEELLSFLSSWISSAG